MSFDGEGFGSRVVAAVRDFTTRQVAPLEARLWQLEQELNTARRDIARLEGVLEGLGVDAEEKGGLISQRKLRGLRANDA